MAADAEAREVQLNLHVPEGFRTLFATNLIVQHTEHEFVITFFEVVPPALLGTAEMKKEQLESIKEVAGTCLARIAVPASRMESFVQVFVDNLSTYKARMAEVTER